MLRKGKNKKVVIWDNIKSNLVEQAIFILREDNDCDDDYMVKEAQAVIDSFIAWQAHDRKKSTAKLKKNKISFISLFGWLTSMAALSLLFYIVYRAF